MIIPVSNVTTLMDIARSNQLMASVYASPDTLKMLRKYVLSVTLTVVSNVIRLMCAASVLRRRISSLTQSIRHVFASTDT